MKATPLPVEAKIKYVTVSTLLNFLFQISAILCNNRIKDFHKRGVFQENILVITGLNTGTFILD